MADVITRFKLETTQYDSALRDAANGLADFTRKAALAGKEFAKFTQGSVEVARSFGGITTSANNAKDKVKELVSAFNGVAKQYNALTQEQQQSDFGKALAASMEQLKGRISDAKQELYSMGDSGKSTSGIMGMLKEKLTLNIDAFKLFNVGLQAAKAALDVAKDAFFNNEQQLDEWGRIVESTESLYNGFLNALNTGDISGYLQNIDDITRAARAAYDAMDALNTFNAFNQINVEKTRTGMTEAIADFRGGGGSKDAVKASGEAYKNELRERRKLEREAYIEAVGKVAAERGVSKQDLLTALSGTYGSYQQLKNMPLSGTQTVVYGGGMFGGGGSYEKAVPNSVQEKLGDALRRLNDTELQSLQALGAQAERTGNEIAQVDKQLTRVLNGRGGAASGGGRSGGRSTGGGATYAADSIAAQESLVSSLTKKWREAGEAVRDDYKKQLEEAQYVLDRMTGKEKFDPSKMGQITNLPTMSIAPKMEIPEIKMGVITPLKALEDQLESLKKAQEEFGGVSSEVWQNYQQKIDEVTGSIDAFKGKGISNDAKVVTASFKDAASAVGNLGSALSGLDDPGAKIAGTVAQAIANIALAFSSADLKDGETGNVWYWIAATAAGLATMVSTISSIHAATNYAEGGIIKGNSYSGDNILGVNNSTGELVGLNAGEIVLNRAQQSTLANNLQQAGGSLSVHGVLRGEDIVMVADRYGMRTGRGELAFWK